MNPDSGDHSAPRPSGTSRAAALRRLRKARPDLHAEVLAGRMTAHAAMVQAGFRTRTISVPLDVHRAAKAILRHFRPEDVERLERRLAALRKDLS